MREVNGGSANKSVYTPNGTRSAAAERMLYGRPLPLLLRLAAPNALAFLVQAGVGIAEVAIVARLGNAALAGLALTFPVLVLLQMLANGSMGGAVSSAVARSLGSGDRDRADALIWHALAIAAIAGALLWLLYLLAGPSAIRVLQLEPEVAEPAQAYLTFLLGGSVLIWSTGLLGAALRGTGNMRFPALVMILAALLQVPLTGALVLGWFGMPALGLPGAALAVVVVSGLSTCVLLLNVAAGSAIRLRWHARRLRSALFAEILHVGALASFSPLLTIAGIVLANAIIGGFGVASLAGYGIVARLELLMVPLVFGLGVAMTAIVGVNTGAGNFARAQRIAWLGGSLAAVLTGAVGMTLAFQPGLWMNLFSTQPEVVAAGSSYLRIVGPMFALQGLGLALYFASQGAGAVAWPVAAGFVRFFVGIGGAYAATAVFGLGLEAVYVCLAAAMFLYGAITAVSIHLGAWKSGAPALRRDR